MKTLPSPLIIILTAALTTLTDCFGCPPHTPPTDAAPEDFTPETAPNNTTEVIVSNTTSMGATVNISVGADSVVQPSTWAICNVDAGLTCSFTLDASSSRVLTTNGQYLNASITFNDLVGCGSTVAEFTANNPNGYGTADISLVNGVSNFIEIVVDDQILAAATDGGDTNALGVFPYGCDICVARQNPPCDIPSANCMTPGSCGCKTGTQYNPTVPCQITYQRADAGSILNVLLLP
jgi:hypothetical protein